MTIEESKYCEECKYCINIRKMNSTWTRVYCKKEKYAGGSIDDGIVYCSKKKLRKEKK